MSGNSMLGTMLGGRFRVIDLLGQGGMGDVFLAEHAALDRKFAIKIMKRSLLDQREAVERFRREARAASRLDHPGVVYITDFGQTDDGRLYLAMEFIEGTDLRQVIKDAAPGVIPLGRTVSVLRQIADAVAAAHRAGVIHRDLKPGNVMLVTDGRGHDQVKIFDFGLAKILVDPALLKITTQGTIFGTPAYMSPEQALGLSLDARTDVYSFGVLAFEMCTGKLPFLAENTAKLLIAHRSEPPPRPSSRMPSGSVPLPEELDTLIHQCLDKDPGKRPQEMDVVLRVLDACGASPKSMPALSASRRSEKDGDALAETVARWRKDATDFTVKAITDEDERCETIELDETSLTEIDQESWTHSCRIARDLAALLREKRMGPTSLTEILCALAEMDEQILEHSAELTFLRSQRDDLEKASASRAALLRNAIIDLVVERSRIIEDLPSDQTYGGELDEQIARLDRRLAEVEQAALQKKRRIDQESAKLESGLLNLEDDRYKMELELLEEVRQARPGQPPSDVAAAYHQLECQLGVSPFLQEH